jgi:hypothetical protein
MTAEFDNASFVRVALALRPYLNDIVFVGGWAHRLFRLHPLALNIDVRPLMTMDADIAAPNRLPMRGRSLRQLLSDARFTEEPSGDDAPPRTEYHFGEPSGVYVQFITPLAGDGYRHDGSPDATQLIQGIAAEKLRYIDLLLSAPWTVELTEAGGYPIGPTSVPIKVCNPVSYLTQKVLSLPTRKRDKRGKDVLYIYDTLLLFGGALDDLRRIWSVSVRPRLAKRTLRVVMQSPEDLFGRVTDSAREASIQARSSRGQHLRVDDLIASCRLGLSEIFAA